MVWLRQQRLKDVQPAGREAIHRRGHIESPDAIRGVAHDLHCLLATALETREPVAKSQRVVLAQTLYIARLEARVLGGGDQRVVWTEPPVGKDVLLDEGVPPPEPALEFL